VRFPLRFGWNSQATYVGLLAASFLAALVFSEKLGPDINDLAYNAMFRMHHAKPWQTEAVVLAIDEDTLVDCGGIRGIRGPLARALRVLAGAHARAVAVDVILADPNPQQDAALAEALGETPNLAISTDAVGDPPHWQNPRPEFLKHAVLASSLTDPGYSDDTRSILIDFSAGRERRRALALEAFRLSRGAAIRESLSFTGVRGGLARDEIQVGAVTIPVELDKDGNRVMRVRFFPPGMSAPEISMKRLLDDPAQAVKLAGKVVFVGLTAQNVDVRDRLFTPVGRLPGVAIHVAAYETMARGTFLVNVENYWEYLVAVGLLAAIGLVFRYLPGWRAYVAGTALLILATAVPYMFFVNNRVFPFATSASVAWLGTLTAASYYHLVVRRNLRIEQTSRERYQQAMHFVTHEMRTPLSAIQGSSELISRYALSEEKRKQIAQLINSESKRLARMVEIFLNVERLTAGQMELKREAIPVKAMVEVCVERARPLGDRKRITIRLEPVADEFELTGDRELMEYACYNLLTNAVKYSPERTQVTVSVWKDDARIRIAVKDQGIGMDQKEVKQIFQKFYRTKKAEESGEAGTGIGLSIVQQIVEQHGGRIEVTSQPGAGSCFTLVMPARALVSAPAPVHRD
jgi:signal transduction histidine kinase